MIGSISACVRNSNDSANRWLVGPERNAAGRLAIFRVLYSLFFLWHLSGYTPANVAELPKLLHTPIALNRLIPWPPSPVFLDTLASLLAAALVLLLVGYRTRTATFLVGVCAGLLESYYISADFEHSTIFVAAFIPLFMFIGGSWGEVLSLDSALRRQRGLPVPRWTDSGPRFSLPIRALLLVLVALFVSAGIYKLLPSSTWYTEENVFGHLMQTKRIEAAALGLPTNPAANLFVESPILEKMLRIFAIAFEAGFFVALLGRNLRGLMLSTALIFHCINAYWLVVTFTPILIVYAAFIDWPGLDRQPTPRRAGPGTLLRLAPILAVSIALFVAIVWTRSSLFAEILSLGGVLSWHTAWYPVFPLAAIWFARSAIRLARSVQRPDPS